MTRVATPGSVVSEDPIVLNRDLDLTPGDAVGYDQEFLRVLRNTESGPLILCTSSILATDQPGFLFVEASS